MSNRFIVVDPSFTSHEGDRWQYAVDLAKSAHELGYEFILVTHRTAPSIKAHLAFDIQEFPVFEHTFFQHGDVYARHKAQLRPAAERRRSELYKEGQSLLDRRIHQAHDRGQTLRALALTRKKKNAARIATLKEKLASLFLRSKRVKPFNRDDFAIAFARVLRKISPGPGDRLFFHTMTYGMMESLSEVTAELGHTNPYDTDAYFLFHFGAKAPDAATYLDSYYSYAAYGSIADRMRVGSPFARMHYLATSDVLCEEAAQILGAPVSLWHGLVDMRRIARALGDADQVAAIRSRVASELLRGEVRILVRAADLDAETARAVSRACHLVQHRGHVARLRVIYHQGVLAKLRDIVGAIDFPNIELVDTEDNDTYVREIAAATLVVLPYDRAKYEKRVSAVLHDCAVIGVPALVPAGTTLETCEFATRFVYHSSEDLLGSALNAVRALTRKPDLANQTITQATRLLGSNTVARLLECSPKPSMFIGSRGAIANVVMPLWGRVGSSFAMEAQVRYLLERGYFVNQVFLMDKAVDPLEAVEYFWKMLKENSRHTRGSVQRVAFWDAAKASHGRTGRRYLTGSALDQFQQRIARNLTEDAPFDAALKRAEVTVVNHVFHAAWAKAKTGGKRILETHDIQSYQIVNWPLLNEQTMEPERISALLASEMKSLAEFDHVVNVAPDEHRILSKANSKSSLVTPYLPRIDAKGQYKSVADMASALNWHESYRHLETFDLLLVGDSHPANRESALWFVNEVFRPYLQPRGITLAVVGRLSDVLHKSIGGVPYVFYVGFVDDLESVKALSRLSVLPDRRGTGISIKTLEAFASGLPFVATSVALRGLRDRLPPDCRTVDQASEFADEVIRALADPQRLQNLGQLARRCYDAVASKDQFTAAWDEIFLRLFPERSQSHRRVSGKAAHEEAAQTG